MAGAIGHAGYPIEHGLANVLERMRTHVANCGTDDFYENWAREVLERRPLILAAAIFEGRTAVWLMEPGAARDNADDGVLCATASHLLRADGATVVDRGRTGRDIKQHLLTRIASDVDWLVKEQKGEFMDRD